MAPFQRGARLAQLGNPDMRTPIAHALAWPERIESGVPALNLFDIGRLEFEAPDSVRFPCLRLAEAAIRAGGTAPAILNAANEIAVSAFLEQRLTFTNIAVIIEQTLEALPTSTDSSLEAILNADIMAREVAERMVVSQGEHRRSRMS